MKDKLEKELKDINEILESLELENLDFRSKLKLMEYLFNRMAEIEKLYEEL